jgi:hypothetical protein
MSWMILIQVAAENGFFILGFDITSAFLLASNDFENHAHLPASLVPEDRRRVRVLKAWYGEKQAPKLFYELLSARLKTIGYIRCPDSPCLFVKFSDKGGVLTMISIHVDDGFVASKSKELIEEFRREIQSVFDQLTFNDPIKLYTSVEIDYDQAKRTMHLSQSVYIEKEVTYCEDRDDRKLCCKTPVNTPMFNTAMNMRLALPNEKNGSLLEYTGKLRYIVDRTRPGCLNAVGEISNGGSKFPSDLHVKTLNKTINYLKNTASMKLSLGGDDPDSEFFGVCDAAHRTEVSSKPRLGGALYKGRRAGAFYCFSQQGTLPARSSTTAEIMALDKLLEPLLVAYGILRFLGYRSKGPIKIYMDSKSGIELCENLKVSSKTSSINMRINYIRDLINRRVIMLVFIPGAINPADVLTKSLPAEDFQRHEYTLQHGFDGESMEQRANLYRIKMQSKKLEIHYLYSTDCIDELIEQLKNSV